MITHLCVPIDRALEELQKGNNLFDGTPLEAFHALMEAQGEGKTYYSGCDNMEKDGSCGGHKQKDDE